MASTDCNVSFTMPKALIASVKKRAKAEDMSVSAVVRRCLRDWLELPPEPKRKAK